MLRRCSISQTVTDRMNLAHFVLRIMRRDLENEQGQMRTKVLDAHGQAVVILLGDVSFWAVTRIQAH